jgi:hypothetical protein
MSGDVLPTPPEMLLAPVVVKVVNIPTVLGIQGAVIRGMSTTDSMWSCYVYVPKLRAIGVFWGFAMALGLFLV